ncbi:MAG: SulP family inorganic anion transporter, partial [Demequina sp.]|nr:SulP family inorganic anion transporter [Demequina sp.]
CHSIQLSTLRRMPKSETSVMVTTVLVVVFTHNLAYGVVAGVILASVLFARRVAHLANVEGGPIEGDTRVYKVTGELFFASSNDLFSQFDYSGDPGNVIIDMSDSHVWDASTVATLDSIVYKYERHGKTVSIDGLNEASLAIHDRMSGNLGAGH